MLAKLYRLPASIRLSRAKFVKSPDYVCKYGDNNLPVSRFGFIVRKSVDKRAVIRNRIRRRFRNCIEQSIDSIKPGTDMLFILEKGIIEKKQQDLLIDVSKLLRAQNLV